MPHLIVDFANNLSDEELRIDALLETLCDTAVGTGLFPRAGLRARAHRATAQRVGDGSPDKAFVHVAMNVGQGRSLDDRQRAGAALFEAFRAHMAPALKQRQILLSFEMREIDTVKFNYRNPD